jgi:cytidine deaminase
MTTSATDDNVDVIREFGGITADEWQSMHDAACRVQSNAYAPYSEFKVGAAILAGNRQVYAGCNVENASGGATVCAERSAVSNAVSDGQRELLGLCVVTNLDRPAAPCGICRQVLVEFTRDLPILMANCEEALEYTSLDDILPRQFTPDDLLGPDAHS